MLIETVGFVGMKTGSAVRVGLHKLSPESLLMIFARCRRSVLLMALLLIPLLSACSEKAEVRYRMTFEVEDNGKVYQGSGVWGEKTRGGGFPNAYTSDYNGEAIPIDMGDKGTLFVLTAGRDAPWLPSAFDNAFYGDWLFGDKKRVRDGLPLSNKTPVEKIRDIAQQRGKSALLDCANPPHEFVRCPFMVRFGNINDPQSVVAVDPADIGATFGPGVRLRPVIITVTDEDVNIGHMMKRLPWLSDFKEKNFDGTDSSYLATSKKQLMPLLSCGEFSRECYE